MISNPESGTPSLPLAYIASKNLQKLNRIGKCNLSDEEIFKVANSRLGLYRRSAGDVMNYTLSPKILGLKTKDRLGLVDPLTYYLARCT